MAEETKINRQSSHSKIVAGCGSPHMRADKPSIQLQWHRASLCVHDGPAHPQRRPHRPLRGAQRTVHREDDILQIVRRECEDGRDDDDVAPVRPRDGEQQEHHRDRGAEQHQDGQARCDGEEEERGVDVCGERLHE